MRLALVFPLLLLAAVPASAQTARGGLGALLGGGGVPSLGGVGVGNAAGMLSYCVRNQLLGAGQQAGGTAGLLDGLTGRRATPTPTPTATGGTAQTVLSRLLGRRDVAGTPGFAAGQQGQLQLGGGQALPVGSLQDTIKSRLCSAVLKRAGSFL